MDSVELEDPTQDWNKKKCLWISDDFKNYTPASFVPTTRILFCSLSRMKKNRWNDGFTFKCDDFYRNIWIWDGSVFLPASSDTVQPNTFLQHSHTQALLESASLTRFPSALVNLALAVRRTRVFNIACEVARYFIIIFRVLRQIVLS